MDFLRNVSTAESFRVTLSSRYQVLQELHEDDEGLNINSQRMDIKEAINYACEEVVGRRKPEQKDGFRQKHSGRSRKGNLRKQQLTIAEQGQQRKKHGNNMLKRTVKLKETSEQIRGTLWIEWHRKQRRRQQMGT